MSMMPMMPMMKYGVPERRRRPLPRVLKKKDVGGRKEEALRIREELIKALEGIDRLLEGWDDD